MIQIENQIIPFVGETSKNVSFSTTFISAPAITALPVQNNVEVFVSNLTTSGCTLNTSATFTGAIRVVAVRG